MTASNQSAAAAFWPRGQPRHVTIPETDLFHNAEVSARRYPAKPFLVFYDTPITFSRFQEEASRLAGFLQAECGVRRGDRVLLCTQNSPHFVIGYYAVLRAGGVVVPVNPMNLAEELRQVVADCGARVAITTQELLDRVAPLLREPAGSPLLERLVVGAYVDYLEAPTDLAVPALVAEPRRPLQGHGVLAWHEAIAWRHPPAAADAGPDDLAMLAYTSGTTGQPKGCMLTHRNVMYQILASGQWANVRSDNVMLSTLPLFHATGMIASMHIPLYFGCTVIQLPRWDREAAALCIERYRVSNWSCIPTMMVDFLADPRIGERDLSSLTRLSGGGAAMPAAVAERLQALGLTFIEGYGLTETIAATHINPDSHPRKQCLGIPIMDVDSRVIDPVTLAELPAGEVGEIVTHGPQVFRGYWGRPEADREIFVRIEGKRFLRTGDLGYVDGDGFFYMVDRLKRMINAAGFKVWPAEVESLMYRHPAVQEACVVASPDERRGETVKAFVVLRESERGRVSEQDLIEWCRASMAAYKVPRIVAFVAALPRSGSGKILWRELQEGEWAGAGRSRPSRQPSGAAG